jgi:alkanesulfonate monooxygenase SsuD/methylene tetrahydromethanopterin reductase-like flavin-dependent oxidoreductase (luciferase family)
MWSKGSTSFSGHAIDVDEAMTYPRPVGDVDLIIGGGGEKRTLAIAAAHADAVNVIGNGDVVRRKRRVVVEHRERVGRDPEDVALTTLEVVLVGEDRRHVNELVEAHRGRTRAADFRQRSAVGTTDELITHFEEVSADGVRTVFVTMPDLVDNRPLERFGPIIEAFS